MPQTQPDDLTYAAEVVELRSQVAAAKLAHKLRMARNRFSTHPDLREPDYDDYEPDHLAASEAAEQENDE